MGRIFENQISSLQISLDEAENTLNSRISAPVPRDLDSLEHMVIQHKDFEQRLQVINFLRPLVTAGFFSLIEIKLLPA